MIRGGTSMTPAMRAYLRASGVATGDADEESDDPVIRGYENARTRAVALGMKNADQSPGGGLLHNVLKWVDTPRAVVYGLATEGINALEGEGFDTNRMWNTIDRGRNEGEGFGKVGVLRTTEDDPFWERALKFVPAVGLDLITDPTNYLTLGTSSVPKTAVGQVARSAAKGALDDVIRAAGREAGEGLAREAGESVVADLAKRQLRYSGGVLDEAITPTLRQGEKEAVRDLAAERLADVIGTARVAGTGRTVTAALRQELLDLGFSNVDELALQVTRNLPRELRGGLGLEVPFTRIGAPLTRGGGAGTNAVGLGRAADLYNEVRLAGRARLRGQESLLTKLSGESGQMYGTVLRDIRQQEGTLLDGVNAVLRTPGKASADDLAAVVESNIRKRVASGQHVALANSAVEAAQRAIADFGDDSSADNIFRAAFHQHNLDEALQGFSRDEARVVRVITAADQMRAVFEQAAERRGMRVAGGRDYVPRLVTVDEYNYRKGTSPARTSTVGDSDSMRGRYAYEELEVVLDDEGVMRLVGRDLSVPEINEASGRKVFEDNPFIIVARQTDKDVRSIEATEVARVLRERGLLTRDPRTRAQTVGEVQKDVRDAAKKLSRLAPEMSEDATVRASAAAEALGNAQNERTVARSAGAAARQNASDAAVQVRDELATVERQWTEANAAVRRLEGQLRRAQAAQDIAEKRRIQQQLSRARKKRVKVDKDLKNARRRLRGAEQRADAFRGEVRDEYVALNKKVRSARKRAETAAAKAAEAPGDAALERRAANAARKVEQAEQEVQDFLVRTDAANVSKQMLDRVAAERETVEALTDTAGGARQRIDDLTQRLSVLDERIANPTDPATLRAAERLAQFPPEQLDEIERITNELDRFRSDAAYKAQEVEKLKAQRNQLNREAQSNVPAERQTKIDEKKAADLARRAAAAQAAAQGAERELIESVKRINAIVEAGGWEEASQLFTELATRYRGTGAPKSVRKAVRKGKQASELLGKYRSQDAVFSRLSAERGLVPLGNEPGRASIPMAFDGWMAGQGISDALDTMYRLSSDGAGLRKALAPYLDPYMRLFKTWATVGRGPGYHVRNFIGGMINNWLLGVRVGAVSPAFRISRSIERTMKAVDADVASGKVLASQAEAEFTRRLKKELNWRVDIAGTSAYDVARGFLAEGVQYSRINEHIERAVSDKLLNAGTFAERKAARTLTPDTAAAVRRGGDGLADMIGSVADSRVLSDNAWLRANVWAAEESERALRLAAYIEGYGRYGDQVSASLFARSAHFDYQDLTETERSLKMIVPFYTWTRNNIPFQLRQLINRPGSIQRLDAIATNLQASFGDPDSELTPEWMGRRMGFETPISLPGGGKLAVLMESPQLDLFAMFGDDGLNPIRMDEIAESLGPIVRGGFETVTGRDMTTGQESDGLTMLRNLVPPAGQAIRLGGLTERDRERAVSSWASFLTGAPVATVTERSRRSEARRRTEQLSPRIKEALAPYLGEGEEIDSKWLQEVGATNTPERVLELIEQGYGRKGGAKSSDDLEGLSPAMRAFLRASS